MAMAFAMVSNIKYRSFKDFEFRDKMPFVGLIALVLAIAFVYLDPPSAFLAIGLIYMVSGALFYALDKFRSTRSDAKISSENDES